MRFEHIEHESAERDGGAVAGISNCASSLRSPASRLTLRRRGISLLEVLISMFVLLFGLMGVAAIFPVGNHYAARGDQYERGAALAGTAFAEIKARGLLNPSNWVYSYYNDYTDTFLGAGGNFAHPIDDSVGAGHAFVLDPLGAAETASGDSTGNFFPYGAEYGKNPWQTPMAGTPPLPGGNWPIRRMTWRTPDPTTPGNLIRMPTVVAQSVFSLRDDLTVQLPTKRDQPGIQRENVDNNGTNDDPTDDLSIARANVGSYTWLATVLPTTFAAHRGMQSSDPRHGSFSYEVSVAVMFKREGPPSEDSERMLAGELAPGGDLVLFDPADDYDLVEAATKTIRPGRWIALAGVDPKSGKFLLRWYRLLSIDDEVTSVATSGGLRAGVNAMIEGPTWPARTSPSGAPLPAVNLRAILLPGVIGVTTQTVKLAEE